MQELTIIESSELAQHEDVIRRGLNTFVEVGSALLAIRDGKLYRAEFGTFEDYCQDRWNMTHRRANQLVQAAEVASNLGTVVPVLPASERQARPLAPLAPEQQREVWAIAVDTAPNGKVTSAHVERTVQEYITPEKPSPHVSNNSGNNEWYTPPEFIEAARDVLGSIDLDPASSEYANKNVKAKKFYTIEDNGLEKKWAGRVWMNPPYALGLVDKFAEKLRSSVDAGSVTGAIVLVNNATETGWFRIISGMASAVCFPQSRIRFLSPDGELGSPLQGQAFLYIGDDVKSFKRVFEKFGLVWRK
jgi:phage N-6-adenine-methyltransferase